MIRNLLVVTAIVLILSATASAQFPWGQNYPTDRQLITVYGQADVMVAPDEVIFRLKVENVNLNLNTAKAKTDEDVKKVFALANTYKIERQNVQTDFIRINERYTDPIQNRPREFKGYAVTQTTTILLKDLSRFEDLIADVVKAGISDVSDVTFRASEMRKAMDKARALAMRAAREKATALAGEIGQRIGKASNITEVGTTVSAAYDEDSSQYPSNNSNSISQEIGRNISDNQSTIAPGMISITVRVKVSFELN